MFHHISDCDLHSEPLRSDSWCCKWGVFRGRGHCRYHPNKLRLCPCPCGTIRSVCDGLGTRWLYQHLRGAATHKTVFNFCDLAYSRNSYNRFSHGSLRTYSPTPFIRCLCIQQCNFLRIIGLCCAHWIPFSGIDLHRCDTVSVSCYTESNATIDSQASSC